MLVFQDFSHSVLKPQIRYLISKGLLYISIHIQSSKPYNKRSDVIFQSKKISTL